MNVEDLRSEFVEQVIQIRKKILNNMRAKTMKKCFLDGQMWIGLAQQYVDAINGGTIPSIESSWSYIQRARARNYYDQL